MSKHLVDVFGSGKGLDRKDLYSYLSFYKAFPAIVDTLCRQLPILSWSHYRALLIIHDSNARTWYEQEALSENWSVCSDNDGPTTGIVLCADTDDDIARYSVLHGNDQLFASKYVLYLPSEEGLREEIENQKTMFYLQYGDRDQ